MLSIIGIFGYFTPDTFGYDEMNGYFWGMPNSFGIFLGVQSVLVPSP